MKQVLNLHRLHHPVEINLAKLINIRHPVASGFAEEQFDFICLVENHIVVVDDVRHLGQGAGKVLAEVLLDDVAREEEVNDVEVAGLVISELDEAIQH